MQWSICYFNHEDKVLHDRAVRCGIVRSPAGEKGRKATSIAETRRDVTRKDEGRQGSRTVALNAVPSDRQHRLLCESLARFSLSSFRARLSSLCTISVFFFFVICIFFLPLFLLRYQCDAVAIAATIIKKKLSYYA